MRGPVYDRESHRPSTVEEATYQVRNTAQTNEDAPHLSDQKDRNAETHKRNPSNVGQSVYQSSVYICKKLQIFLDLYANGYKKIPCICLMEKYGLTLEQIELAVRRKSALVLADKIRHKESEFLDSIDELAIPDSEEVQHKRLITQQSNMSDLKNIAQQEKRISKKKTSDANIRGNRNTSRSRNLASNWNFSSRVGLKGSQGKLFEQQDSRVDTSTLGDTPDFSKSNKDLLKANRSKTSYNNDEPAPHLGPTTQRRKIYTSSMINDERSRSQRKNNQVNTLFGRIHKTRGASPNDNDGDSVIQIEEPKAMTKRKKKRETEATGKKVAMVSNVFEERDKKKMFVSHSQANLMSAVKSKAGDDRERPSSSTRILKNMVSGVKSRPGDERERPSSSTRILKNMVSEAKNYN